MKRAVSSFVLYAVVVLLLSGVSAAHPPKEVKIGFDPESKMLTVTAIHDTKDVTKHYVGTIQVDLNGEKMIEQKFKAQVDANEQLARFWINDANAGDTLTVTAICNIAGKKQASLVIGKKAETAPAKTN
jgi:DNA polymerase II large subunit